MAPDGELDTIELEPRHAEVARESFRRAGVRGARAHPRRPGARACCRELVARGPFDLVFIDADKEGYPRYLAWAADNLRPGGVVAARQRLPVRPPRRRAHAATAPPQIAAMHAVHETLANSGRLRATVLPTGEGLAVGVKLTFRRKPILSPSTGERLREALP